MIYGVGLGSNVGDRTAHVRAGIAFLKTLFKPGLRVSSLYQTSPVDCPPGSEDFVNAVVEGEFEGDPGQLYRLLKAFEKTRGERPILERNAPRALDLDLLYGQSAFQSDEITLPHPRLHLRRFVLQPLAEICPERVVAGQTRPVADLLRALENDERVLRIP